MSAEVLGSLRSSSPQAAPSAAARSASAALLEPSLVNRLLAVSAAIFAIPVLVELRALVLGAGAPSEAALTGTVLAAALLTAGFGTLLRAAPRAPELRSGRVLCAVLGGELAVLAVALVAHLR